jgi:CheY-like chemotaxis protein
VEGEGSTFYFTLPAAPVGSTEALPSPRERSGAVVLVTEEGADPSMLAGHLARQDFDVETVRAAAGGQDLLNRILRTRPGAVVLDMDATSDQGWEIVRMLKAHPSTQDIPVFFHWLGSGQERDTVLELDNAEKPVGAADLAHMLARRGLLNAAGEHRTERTILVVDDEPRLCSVYAQMIQAQLPHCRVYTTYDGRQALDLIRQLIPDLVLLDLMMPEMDGFDVLNAMREGETTRHIPVVVLTARHLTEEDVMRLGQGVSAVLSKGVFTRAEIIAHVRQALSRGPESSAEAQRCVRQAIAFVHTHYAEPITRGDIAQHLAISDRHLARCFNEILGISPMTYLSRYRIEQAKTMLASGRAQVTDVAWAVGFSSQSYFSRVFAREVGISPSAYQRGDR